MYGKSLVCNTIINLGIYLALNLLGTKEKIEIWGFINLLLFIQKWKQKQKHELILETTLS